ncbi:FAD binding domain-containing protein [Hoyosella rhizosphaerae]|uniref:Oxidoreductase (Molybdopterin dehydrogenase?) n=1 Tax=Hoyosella rhizosphaerae TaxID=1755582 RepID=A0A916U9I2_9ACTN|nr:FAD binding domain-containing protein [Hoyosella rhizosphaerae]MBN4927621.1 FAD binding domain-containing protein [Hoyosella rhizosphaerae]GGC63008.1 putative oxidoreductase (molybdopterin dehydrogenase?) [Hoyosella rhizosphaerae]
MDLHTIDHILSPRTRTDIPVDAAAILAGGTWIYSEPQPAINRLIDITALKWDPLTITEHGLDIAATCTIEQLISADYPAEWGATKMFRQCADALAASIKVWNTATVGGNICLALPAGSMIALAAALEGTLTIWRPDGSDRTTTITEFVTGPQQTTLQPGEILRSVHLPAAALRQHVVFRRISQAPQGRSGALLIGRATETGYVLAITAATDRPILIGLGSPGATQPAVNGIPQQRWYTDPHGEADWRQHVTTLLAQDIIAELAKD